jgi:hypothetical protein
VAIRVVRSDGVVEDVRSDDEEEEEEVEKLEPKKNK